MPDMLTLLIITSIFWTAYFGFIRILFDMMQEGGAFDIFGWSKFRAHLFRSDKATCRLIENALGGCGKCTALWWSLPWFGVYASVCHAFHAFPYPLWLKLIWLVLFVCINFSIGYKSLNNGMR